MDLRRFIAAALQLNISSFNQTTVAHMKPLRILCAGSFFLFALPFLAIGLFIAVKTDAKPMHVLNILELRRVEKAAQFVDRHFAQHDRVPTADEFQGWAHQASPDLRLEGVGFTYKSSLDPGHKAYEFSFWVGDAWVTWRPRALDARVAEISPTDAFVAGSKWADVLIFLGIGMAALLIAKVFSLSQNVRNGA